MISANDELDLALPAEFVAIPPEADIERLPSVVTALGVEGAAAARLQAALSAVRSGVGDVSAWALVLAPESGFVDAALTLRVHLVAEDDSPSAYLANLGSEASTEIVNRSSEQRLIAGRPAAVVHDFTVPAGSERPALERAYAAVFVSDALMFEFGLLTQDMHLFEDASAYLTVILEEGLRWRNDD
jgi:hypothetical protein